MDNTLKALQLIFYILWIPLGIFIAIVLFQVATNNPFARMGEAGSQAGGGFGPGGMVGGNRPSSENIDQFIKDGQQPK